MTDKKLFRWQSITLSTLFVGYAGYYVCRSNLAAANPLILQEYQDQGLTMEQLGNVGSVGVLFYAAGKVTNGMSADFLGGRTLFLLGMVASIVCTLAFGLAGGLLAFTIIWAANRYVQSMGWVALVKTATRWFPFSMHATIMGVLSMSFLVGDAIARLYLGEIIDQGFGWRQMFFISAATLFAIAILNFFLLKPSPSAVGCPEPVSNPLNAYREAQSEHPTPESFKALLIPLLTNVPFLLVCVMNFGLTLIRESFNFWSPTYLTDVAGLSPGIATQASLVFPLVGGISALLAGWLADCFRGRLGLVILPCVVLLALALWSVQFVPVDGNPNLAVAMLAVCAFFLLAPYSYLSGVVALIIGGKKGASTVAGFSDAAGYAGAFLSGGFIGRIAQTAGWSAVINTLAAVAALTSIAAIVYCFSEQKLHRQCVDLQPSEIPDRAEPQSAT